MTEKTIQWLRPLLFTLGGALVGWLYYYFVGCAGGSCPITADPYRTMAYMALVGWILSGVFSGKIPCG